MYLYAFIIGAGLPISVALIVAGVRDVQDERRRQAAIRRRRGSK